MLPGVTFARLLGVTLMFWGVPHAIAGG